jgi:hypothetical protein
VRSKTPLILFLLPATLALAIIYAGRPTRTPGSRRLGPTGARWYIVAGVAAVETQAGGTGQPLPYVGLVAAVAAVGGLLFG